MPDLQLLQQDYDELECIRSDIAMMIKSFNEDPMHYTESDSIVTLLNNTIHVIQTKQQNIENYIHERKGECPTSD